MRNPYIMLDACVWDNVKTRRILRKMGIEGILSMLSLWTYTARFRPAGVLYDMDCQDIADAVKYGGDPEEFCRDMTEAGLLDMDEAGVYSVHDWEVHNPWFLDSKKRQEVGRENARKRWNHKPGENSGGGDGKTKKRGRSGENFSENFSENSRNFAEISAQMQSLQDEVQKLREENEKLLKQKQEDNANPLGTHCNANGTPMQNDAYRIERNRKEESNNTPPPPSGGVCAGGVENPADDPNEEFVREVVTAFRESCPGLSQPRAGVGKDSMLFKQILGRRSENSDRRDVGWWQRYWRYVAASDYLMGRKKDWAASALWLTKKTNMEKVLEGEYDNRTAPARASPGMSPVSPKGTFEKRGGFFEDAQRDGVVAGSGG